MKRLFQCKASGMNLLLSVLIIFIGITSEAHATIFDLRSQWSESQNPNGPWAYMAGDSCLPACPTWTADYGTQFAWAGGSEWTEHVPAWFQAKANYWWTSVGDIVVHTTAPYSSYQGATRVVWTSPVDSEILISGDVWLARPTNPPRSTFWYLQINNVSVSSGYLYYDGNIQDYLSDGSGGVSALSSFVHTGDTVALVLVRGGDGLEDYVGVDFTITTIPEPATALLMGLGVLLISKKN